MADDLRTRSKLHEFFLRLAAMSIVLRTWPRTPSGFRSSTRQIVADLHDSLDLFLEDVVWSEAPISANCCWRTGCI